MKNIYFIYLFCIFKFIVANSPETNAEKLTVKFAYRGQSLKGRPTHIDIIDIDQNGKDEIIISEYLSGKKYISIWSFNEDKISSLLMRFTVTPDVIYYDVADIDRDYKNEIILITSNDIYYYELNGKKVTRQNVINYSFIRGTPYQTLRANFFHDVDGDGFEELTLTDVDGVHIYETDQFRRISHIISPSQISVMMTPYSDYPVTMSSRFPLVRFDDIDGNGKEEMLIKSKSSITLFEYIGQGSWKALLTYNFKSDRETIIGGAFNYSFPDVADVDQDGRKEIILNGTTVDLSRFRFNAYSHILFLDKKLKLLEQIELNMDGVPANLPFYIDTNDNGYKDIVFPLIRFNWVTVLGLMFRGGEIKLPFFVMYDNNGNYDMELERLFEAKVKIDNTLSMIAGLLLYQRDPATYPVAYFHDYNDRKQQFILNKFYYSNKFDRYRKETAAKLPIELTDVQQFRIVGKLANLFGDKQKEAVYLIGNNFFTFFEEILPKNKN